MNYPYKNMAFSGGGIKGIAYLGVLDVLNQEGIYQQLDRLAGTSAGAITAVLTCLNMAFEDLNKVAQTLNYSKVPGKSDEYGEVYANIIDELSNFVKDAECVYRLLNNYGWYSTDYIYKWLRGVIGSRFKEKSKRERYTFSDFKNKNKHKDNIPFKDLYIVGTDMVSKKPLIFSYETTPYMEVAEAVRISISIPLFFEAVIKKPLTKRGEDNVYSDGGVLFNYPLEIFDNDIFMKNTRGNDVNPQSIGAKFKLHTKPNPINNIVNYIENLFSALLIAQETIYNYDSNAKERTIEIETGDVKSTDFNIQVGDDRYNYLYEQGKLATIEFLEEKKHNRN